MYTVHLNLIGKRVVDFLLVFIHSTELFFARTTCYGKGATNENRLKLFEETGSVWPRISSTRGHLLPPFFVSEN